MTAKFQGVDFYDIDSLLSEEERAIRDTVRDWVDENLMPIIGDAYVAGKFPKQLVPGMAELGLFGANLPEEYGCAGLNNVAYGLIMQELERGDSGVRSFASVQGALVMYPIYAFGSDEQKKKWLPRLASGDVKDVNSIRGFIVPTDSQGFSAKDQKGKLSLRASDTSELVLQDVRAPKDAILPKSGGLKSPLMCLTAARYGIAWGAVGAAMACYD